MIEPVDSPSDTKASVVILGRFNPAIVEPTWAKSLKLVDGDALGRTELIFPSPQGFTAQHHVGGLTWATSFDRFVVEVHPCSSASLEKAASFCQGVLRTLPHTPVSAVGINLFFQGLKAEESAALVSLKRNLGDLGKTLAAGATPTQSAVKVILPANERGQIVQVELTEDAMGSFSVALNFHRQVTSWSEADDALNDAGATYAWAAASLKTLGFT
jgi:hypothetical protein